jgi:hypothetical protein
MKKKYFLAVLISILTFASVASAQPPATGTSKIGWDQAAPSLAEAQGYIYKYYPDSATVGTTLNLVTCIGTISPYQCEVAFPAFTPGAHTLTITAGNIAGESAKSSPLNFAFVVTPSIPTNLKIK